MGSGARRADVQRDDVMRGDAIAKRLEAVDMTMEPLVGLPAQAASLDERVGARGSVSAIARGGAW